MAAVRDKYEKELWGKGYKYVCGCDETGMGSLCGVACVCCVVFPANFDCALLPKINDSKQLSPEKREKLYPLIKQYALDWATDEASVKEIDTLNVYWARFLAMRRALNKLKVKPDYILMDGNKVIPEIDTPQTAIVKGDAKSFSIASASIIAKVDRDRHIVELAKTVHPDYEWAINKGYYSEQHVRALKTHGPTIHHRKKYVEKFI